MILKKLSLINIITILITAIAFTFPLFLYSGIVNLQNLLNNWQKHSNQIAVFLSPSLSNEAVLSFKNKLSNIENIKQIELISKEQALVEFVTFAGINDIPNLLENNPLPATLLITPKIISKNAIDSLLEKIHKFPEVDSLVNDFNWLLHVSAAILISKTIVFILACLFIILISSVIINAIWIKLVHAKEELIILQLLGAPRAFIKRPFLLTGFYLGVVSSLLAGSLVYWTINFIKFKINFINQIYALQLSLNNLNMTEFFILLILGALIGTSAAWCSVSRFLQKI